MKRHFTICSIFIAVFLSFTAVTVGQEKIDTAMIAKIRDEGMNHSHAMEILSYVADVYGPRLTGSPGFKRAADWARGELASFGLDDAHLDAWGPFGRGWELKRYWANVVGEQVFPLISYPKAWSPGTGGTISGEVVYLDAWTDSALETYRGKLKGKIVLFDTIRRVDAHFTPEGRRETDSSLLVLANADMPGQRGRGGRQFQMSEAAKQRALLNYHKWMLCQDEGVKAVLNVSFRGDGGNVFVQQATVPMHPDTPMSRRINAYDPKAPKILPQIVVAVEHYDRLIRMIQKGEHPKIEMDLDVNWTKEDSCWDVIADMPGTDLKDQVVMIGAHFDSWQGGTGATDNGTGDAVCMEAMRILKAVGAQPRRTIRIGLWSGEEEGLLGSQAYVKEHLGEREGTFMNPGTNPTITLKPEAEKFDVYFNDDNGSGKFRGVFMQGNEAVRPIFRAWLAPFKDLGASTLTPSNTGSTDHISFDAIGLPAFQFIQDPLEYDTRTHHSTMDVYERAQEEDVKQGAVIMAAFAYNAAMRDEMIPRKPAPKPSTTSNSQGAGQGQSSGSGKN
jgi:hypothetical protein